MFQRAARFLAVVAASFCVQAASATPLLYMSSPSGNVEFGQPIRLEIDIWDGDSTGIVGGAIAPLALTYPPGIVNSSIVSNNCGTVSAPAGTNLFSATGITVARDWGCGIVLELTPASPGSYTFSFADGGFSGSTGPSIGTLQVTLGVAVPPIVTNTDDTGSGSLRQVIDDINAICIDGGVIRFNIGGTGPHTIAPQSALPRILCTGITIDGYSQPGSHPNEAAPEGATDADIRIAIDGSACTGCDGLTVGVWGANITGLAIHSFNGAGIRANVESRVQVSETFIGTDPGGRTARPNGTGIAGDGGSALDIVGGNLITGNGVGIIADDQMYLANNLIGGDRDGNPGIGNGEGVRINGSRDYYIQDNHVRHNAGRGLVVSSNATASITNNHIWGNGGTGIDVGDDGYNAPNETPPYPFNHPVITSATASGGSYATVQGYVKTRPNSRFQVEFYDNPGPSAPGITEGRQRVGSTGSLTTDSTGFAAFTANTDDIGAPTYVSALVHVDMCGEDCYRTSEFSASVAVTAAVDPWSVTNTNDSGPGSLRAAIAYSNTGACPSKAGGILLPKARARAKMSGGTIRFDIPGQGPHTIRPLTRYEALTCADLVIDAFTQTGSRPNGQSVGDDAIRLVELSGSLAPYSTNGFEIAAGNVTIRGLIVNDFASASGILVSAPSASAAKILGNVIGTDATGSTRRKNSYGIRNLAGSAAITIGTASPLDRNVISGNDIGIRLEGGDFSRIENNYIGLNVQGNAAQANDSGVHVSGTTATEIAGNVISGNLGDGVRVFDSTASVIEGNYIGTDATGVAAVPNGSNGISFSTPGAFGRVGPDNTIAFNGQYGVRVNSTGVSIRANRIHSNGGPGIELGNGGVLPANDSCDADTGGNNWQNYPVITSVTIYSDYINVTGTFDSTGGRNFGLDFFDNPGIADPGYRSGRFLIGSGAVATTLTPSCATPFSVDLSGVVGQGALITATATDLTTGDTSGFSAAVAAEVPVGPPSCNPSIRSTGTGDAGDFTPPYIVVPGESVNIFHGCQPVDSIVWSTAETTDSIDVIAPAAGASATYTFTATRGGLSTVATVRLDGAAVGTPVCSIVPSIALPIDPTNTSPFTLTASCSPLATTFAWNPTITAYPLEYVSGQGTSTATYRFVSPDGGIGYHAYLTPANAAGEGPSTSLIVWVSPVHVSPTSLAFPSTAVGTQSAPQAISIANMSSYFHAPLNGAITGPFTSTPNCPDPLPPGATCTVDIRYAPTAPGAGQAGTATVTVAFPGNPSYTVTLSGSAFGAPAVSLTSSSLTFAPRTVGTTSTAQTVTLANTGSVVLNIASIAATGDFAFASGCAATLAPGASCTIDVTFTPLVPGSRTGTLTILDDAAGSPHTVALGGTGLSTAAAVADISPPLIDFTAQPVGSTSAAELLTVTNSGNAPLTFSSIGITGEFSVVAASGVPTALQCPVTLGPGTSCEIHVTFHPTGPNLREGVLTMVTNVGTLTVRVMGTGLIPAPPQLTLASTLAFGNQPIGTRSVGRALAIRNTSEILATITVLSATGDFSVSDTCATIAAGATCSPLVTFEPTALGPRTGTLTVRTLRDVDPYTVSLTGTGEENRLPVLQLSATSIGFGNAFLGQPVTREVTVRNAGTAPLVISSILASAGFFSDTACITTLGTGASCTVHVTFLPGLPGAQASLLEFLSNAAGSPHHVGLSGTGCFMPTPSRARFGGLICGP